MVDVNEVKNRIINFLKLHGPSIPVQIAKDLKTNTIFTSAFLGELLDEKKIKTSSLRVGGTPLYLLSGQEQSLENFQKYLHPKEQEAFLLLKDSKILKDTEQSPAIRVALRQIKDFAVAFKKDDDIYWRYLSVSEEDVRNILEPGKDIIESNKQEPKKPEEIVEKLEEKIEKPKEEKEIKSEEQEPKKPERIIELPNEKIEKPKEIKIKQENKKITEFNNPLIPKKQEKPVKIKPKSEFVELIIKTIENKGFKIIQEKDYKSKEYNCIVQINTELGPTDFLTTAKDKKTISDIDLDKLLRASQEIPLPALYIYRENLSKKALEYQKKYYSILKLMKI